MGSAPSFERNFKKAFWNLVGGSLSSARPNNPAKIKSVLVLRPDRLGDFVLSVPALMALDEKMGPSGKLTLVAGKPNADLARFLFPEARVWVFRKDIFSRMSLWFKLWVCKFDAVIDLHSYPFSTTTALMCVLSGASVRSGFWATGDFKEYAELSKEIFGNGVKPMSEDLPEVKKSFVLVEQVFPDIETKPAKVDLPVSSQKTILSVTDFYVRSGITSKDKVLGIHPTLLKKDNRWSQTKYVEVIKQLSFVKGLKVVVVHGKGEGEELKKFQTLAKPFPNVFILPSDDLFFILEAAKRFDGMVCNDSGIMHLCAWVTPVYAVFGPSHVKRWGPQINPRLRHQTFQTKDGLCDSVSSRTVALAVRKKLIR